MVAAVLGFAGFLRAEEAVPAEETLEAIAPKLDKGMAPWKGFAPGSWVDIRTTRKSPGKDESISEYRSTLVVGDGGKREVQMRTWVLKSGPDGREVRELAEESFATQLPAEAWFESPVLKQREKLVIQGAEIECRVLEATLVQKAQSGLPGKDDLRRTAKLWYSPTVRDGGVVRIELDADGRRFFEAFSWDAALVEIAREVPVGAGLVRCIVWRHAYVTRDEKSTTTGETASSDAVPGGLVKSVQKTITKTESGCQEDTTVTEVTGFQAKPEGSD